MKKVLVTGGGGFVGKAIVRQLLTANVACTVLGRNRYPELESLQVNCIQGDITDRECMLQIVQGFDVVFHVAALAGIWGERDIFQRINVAGTENIVEACITNKIPALVYTSTPSVVFAGESIENGDENLPYPRKFLCHYARTKAQAEKLVLNVDQNALKTCAIRPHLIWGPEDPHLVPRLVERGKQGKLKIVGDGRNVVDITYIDNVVLGHILAAENLLSSGEAAGKAYFLGQERPVELWAWINELFKELNIPAVKEKVSLNIAFNAGRVLEVFHNVFMIKSEPQMTRFLAEQLAKSHYFSHASAHRDFGYSPGISIEEGMERLLHWLKGK